MRTPENRGKILRGAAGWSPGYGMAAVLVVLAVWAALGATPAAAADCASMTGLRLAKTEIVSATVVPAAKPVPEYCRVLGIATDLPDSPIHFEVALPIARWNGKFFLAGGGGFNGTIPRVEQALAEGYAAAGSDTGHQGGALDGLWALHNPQAQENYAYLATHVVTLLGKQIVVAFYGRREQRSYYVGCSNGGKMGLAEIERYPTDFDGAVVGDPVIDRTKLMMSYTWNAQALAAGPIPPSKISIIERATLAACRISGNEIGGLILTPGRCHFDPKTIVCRSGDGPNCLTAAQAEALSKILRGPVDANGKQLYPGFAPGHEDDYPAFITGNGTANSTGSSQWKFQDQFLRYFVFGPSFDPVKQFRYSRDHAAVERLAAKQDDANPDLSAFRAHGGKLILYHGWADHSIPPLRTIEFYADVIRAAGKPLDGPAGGVGSFARLFMVPGMHHCGNGPGPNRFDGANQGFPTQFDAQHDIVMALDRWVEQGVAPAKIIASHVTNGKVDRTLPLCPYPEAPTYNGSGDIRKASSYRCANHSFWWAVESFPGLPK